MSQQPISSTFTGKPSSSLTLGSALRQFLNNKSLSDVTFLIQQQCFFAHKLILAARSPYFANLIFMNCKENSSLEIEIQDASPEIFYSILEYMYTDTTVLRENTVWEVYKAAKFYQLSELMNTCEQFIISIINEKNVFDHWKNSQLLNAINVSEHCVLFISDRYEENIRTFGLKPISIRDNPDQVYKQLRINEFERKQIVNNAYKSLENYSFPPTNNQPTTSNQQYIQPSSTLPYTGIPVANQNQTLELWSNDNIPPISFPTPESIAAFPQFFNVKKRKEQDQIMEEDQQSKRRKRTQVVSRRMSVISDPTMLGIVFQHIIAGLTRLLEAERTSLFLYDKETDELCSQVAIGEHEIRIPSSKGIAGEVFKSGKLSNVKDAYSNQNFDSNVDQSTGYKTRYVLCSPLLGPDRQIIGVMEVLNKRTGPFNEEDEQHLRTVSAMVSLLIEDQWNTGFQKMKDKVLLVHPSAIRKKSLQLNKEEINKNVISTFTTTQSDSTDWLNNDLFNISDLLSTEETTLEQTTSSNQQQIMEQNLKPVKIENNQPTTQFYGSMNLQQYQQPFIPQQIDIKQPIKQEQEKKKKRNKRKKIDNSMPFMHFRIPRYELQFIQFDADGSKKKSPRK